MDLKEVIETYKGDVFLYIGGITRQGYDNLSTLFEKKNQKSSKVCLVLSTFGGNPDAGYRISRALNHHYKNVEILVPGLCKSAGTLVCIGAKNLIFGDRGELGPLDIQISKPDEMFESMSGLEIIQALNGLENQVLSSFRNYLVDIRGGSRLTTKMAADIAVKLTEAFISPIAEKIDPVTLGEHQRAMQIAFDYGKRLNEMSKSLDDNSLLKLVSDYPSHRFVIDRKEAKELFKNVSAPNKENIGIYLWARKIIETHGIPENPIVLDINDMINSQKENKDENKSSKQTKSVLAKETVSGTDTNVRKSKSKSKKDEQDNSRASSNKK